MRNPVDWYIAWVLSAPDVHQRTDRALGSAIVVIVTAIALILGLHASGVPL